MTFLADTFEKLANDPSWPWIFISQEKSIIKVNGNELNGNDYLGGRMYDPNRTRFVAQSPLTMARLALMVVEEKAEHTNTLAGAPSMPMEKCRQVIFATYDINPSHYAKVQKRVEEADTEDKG